MPSETFSAAQGMAASLESRAIVEKAGASPKPVVHKLGPIYGFDGERYGVCTGCGRRIDGADVAQVKHLFDQHAEFEQHAAERAEAAEVTPTRLPAIRESLRQAADRKSGAA